MNFRTTRIYLRSMDLIHYVAALQLTPGHSSLNDQLRHGQAMSDHLVAVLRLFH